MKIFSGKTKNKIRFVVSLLCIIIILGCLFLLHGVNEKESEFDVAGRWQTDRQEFAYISVFMSPEENWQESDRKTLISSLRMSFQQDSITNEDREDNTEGLIKDCFSCEGVMEFTNGKNAATAKVMATGGDFFFFHNAVWLSGSAYSDEDVMKDRAVIDKELAWKLFGGTNAVGMPFKINGHTYYVAGVVDVSQVKEEKKAYGEVNRAWLPYSSFCKEYSGSDVLDSLSANGANTKDMSGMGTGSVDDISKSPITCYEIIMPNPVKEWAIKLINENLNAEGRKMVIIENSKRTDFFTVMNNLKNFFYKTTGTQPVAYPYWENAARVRDIKRELYTGIIIIAVIYPFLLCIKIIVEIYKTIDSKIKKRMNKKHSVEGN